MYVAYLSPDHLPALTGHQTNNVVDADEQAFHNAQMEGYVMACARLSKEIAAIQRYLPGWLPERPGLK
ncbi:hypothetical protein LJ707_12940 [Mucilaginibacter sp. UR6-1]|uniref:hypothetical protein n=1 Tax=Mucilaginibacter sp. UR6-1 TaxID=1435643 RepID=UPI001E2DEE19|nr:hypothetical protein [Mucilaginibacter sp. UR6-1]MCC8409836.1 hypothetical protein [Mucilaginibacter sp. UR6-1]